ncbi:threonine synthase [Rummeliibacillus sp. TYF005]|uniref:threonine synthase n=1 Tax=unclassified Rummeliibacillus TaxID=2622809 RepID=UPI000E66EC7F|nr:MULTISPECIES: threonine synthase [unclassified Rummeliibacillus]RIJ66348.1 threonine synthase [Rummeliibacillus sp. POC4]RPJ94408.1 threonine synthase [Rummeliibacillus sp. TYF005]
MTQFSFISHLECPKCNKTYDEKQIQQLCECGSPLLVRYNLEDVKKHVTPEEIQRRSASLWRYHELLPVHNEKDVVTLGEGLTPLEKLDKLGSTYELDNLYIKDEGIIPTGSFKTRGASVGISKAKELGVKQLAMPTNGNAGAAWALYAAKANIKATIVMPLDAPQITRKEVHIAGGDLHLINGLISDAGKVVAQLVQDAGVYDASTLKEPYRIEGKKTMGYEIVEQFGWKVPDVILYPTGGGVGIIGIYKAILEMQALGWIEKDKFPRLVAVQAEGCAPIVDAWKKGEKESKFFEDSTTCAFGINVPKALGDFLVLDSLYKTEGCAIAISEQELLAAQKEVASLEGNFVCPEGAATFAAAKKLREQGWIKQEEHVVCLNTGAGIKYPETVEIEGVNTLQPGDSLLTSKR